MQKPEAYIPETWDNEQKGLTSFNPEALIGFDARQITNWVPNNNALFDLCLAEYVFVSLSLALLIAKFFPKIYSQLVSKATHPEYQSLYWGAAVVSNVFVFCAVFVFGRILTLYALSSIHPPTVYVAATLQVIIYITFFLVSLFTNNSNVPIPEGMGKFLINASLCCILYCSVCCSTHRRENALRVLVMFSLMTFIFHTIMEAVSVCFNLIVNVRETVTVTSLYILSLTFLIVFCYYIIMATTDLTDLKKWKQSLKLTARVLGLIAIFGAIMLIIIVYVLLILHLQPEGFPAVVSALLPPVVLSGAGWYLKKTISKKASTANGSKESTSVEMKTNTV